MPGIRRWSARWGSCRPAPSRLIETEDDARAFPAEVGRGARLHHADHALGRRHGGDRRILKERFPEIVGPHKEDICYATTNRQEAVKRVARRVDAMIVIGAPNSSNSQRLREVAERAGCPVAVLVQRAAEIDWPRFAGVRRLGITAGASAPEVLVEEVIDAFGERFAVTVEVVTAAEESVAFNLPRELRAASAPVASPAL